MITNEYLIVKRIQHLSQLSALLESICSFVHQVSSQARLSFIHLFIMHSRDADRWHFRQQTFIGLSEGATSTATPSYCENHSPRLLMVHWQHGEPFSIIEMIHDEYFISALIIYSTSSVMNDLVLSIKLRAIARILVILRSWVQVLPNGPHPP